MILWGILILVAVAWFAAVWFLVPRLGERYDTYHGVEYDLAVLHRAQIAPPRTIPYEIAPDDNAGMV